MRSQATSAACGRRRESASIQSVARRCAAQGRSSDSIPWRWSAAPATIPAMCPPSCRPRWCSCLAPADSVTTRQRVRCPAISRPAPMCCCTPCCRWRARRRHSRAGAFQRSHSWKLNSVPVNTVVRRRLRYTHKRQFLMDLKLTKKIALVTGSTAGIGNAIAASLAREGATVIVNGRTQPAVDAAVETIRAQTGGDVKGFAGDLSLAAAAEDLVRRHPAVDILVNNLGIFEVRAFKDISDADWQRFFDVNVLSGARLARLYFPRMLERNWGRIIFVSSESGYQIPAEMIHYGMTKAAQIAVARGLAELTAGSGVTVNSVMPGPTRSRGAGDFVTEMAT